MPELPEVETIRRDLIKVILQKKITDIKIGKPKIVRLHQNKFIKEMTGNQFHNIGRIGKLLYFYLDRKKFLLVHLKMTGQLIYQQKKRVTAGGHNWPPIGKSLPNKYSHVIFTFADQSQLFFNDQRQFGYMEIVNQTKLDKIKNNYGIEPLTNNFIYNDFEKIIKKRQTNIKNILLNQSLIAGIGNIYADEILHAARIKPEKKANRLSPRKIKDIFENSQTIIARAIDYRGTTFNNYRDSNGQKGNYISQLQVYGRESEPCPRCGHIIVRKKLHGRSAHFCPSCQK